MVLRSSFSFTCTRMAFRMCNLARKRTSKASEDQHRHRHQRSRASPYTSLRGRIPLRSPISFSLWRPSPLRTERQLCPLPGQVKRRQLLKRGCKQWPQAQRTVGPSLYKYQELIELKGARACPYHPVLHCWIDHSSFPWVLATLDPMLHRTNTCSPYSTWISPSSPHPGTAGRLSMVSGNWIHRIHVC